MRSSTASSRPGRRSSFMAEPSPPDGIPGEIPDFGAVVDMNSFYGHGPDGFPTVYETADRAWRLSPPKPAWMQEGTYEFENNTGHYSGEAWDTRRSRYWAVLAGGTAGDGFGSHGVMAVGTARKRSTTPGADYSTYAFQLFASLPWWELRTVRHRSGVRRLRPRHRWRWNMGPARLHHVGADRGPALAARLRAGEGEGNGQRAFSVDMAALDGPVRARWFDPASGRYLAISGADAFNNSGTREFTSPDRRGDGTDDWVLVLDSAPVDSCGSITVTGTYTAPDVITDGVTCEVTAALQSEPSVVAEAQLSFGTA